MARENLHRRKWLRFGLAYSLLAIVFWLSIRWLGGPETVNLIGTRRVAWLQRDDDDVQAEIQLLWDRIEAAMAKVSPSTSFGPPASDREIEALEKSLGFRLPCEVRASLKVHNGTDELASNHALYDTQTIESTWVEYIDILSGNVVGPLNPDPHRMASVEWHPGWIPVGGWDVYEILVNLETGEVCHWDEHDATWQTVSWRRWLENVADRLESAEPKRAGSSWDWEYSENYWTPGSEEPIE